MEFKDKIRTLRLKNNMTLEEVAKIAEVSAPTIQRYESGEIQNVRKDKIAKLAKALNTTPAYLMGWDEPISDSEFKEMMAFLNPYWVGVKYLEDRNLGEQYEIITYKDDEYGEIANELFEKYSEIKDLNEDDVAYEISKFFSKKKNYSKLTRLEKYDKEHQEEIEKLSKEVEDIENSSPLVQRIEFLAKKKGISITKLEKDLGFSKSLISKWKGDDAKSPSVDKVMAISQYFNVPTDYILGNDVLDIEGLGSALKDERESQNISIEEAANEIGILPEELIFYEENDNVSKFIYEKLMSLYGYNYYEFLNEYGFYDDYIPEHFEGDADKFMEFKKAEAEDAMSEVLDDDFRRVARAYRNMQKVDKEKMLNILKAAFEDFFEDDK